MISTWAKAKVPDIMTLFSWFIIYSYIGWVYETIYCSMDLGRYVDRGFLNGPLCPIYGLCIVSAVVLFTNKFKSNISLFLACALLASALEYITSLWMELVFGRRWWNYSDKLLNINGRICIEAAFVFGICGVLVVRYLHPRMVRYINENFHVSTVKKANGAIIFILILDILVTFQMNLQ